MLSLVETGSLQSLESTTATKAALVSVPIAPVLLYNFMIRQGDDNLFAS
jgi:hypothetical protein